MTHTPMFSIIIPTWERVKDGRLRRCLNSVATQTFEDFECIVVDDGSKEDVRGLVAEFQAKVHPFVDERFRCVRIGHAGRVVARNEGMRAATGKNICWLDSDDCYNPEYLNTFNYHINQDRSAKLWVCGSVYFGMKKVENTKKGRNYRAFYVCPRWTKIRPAWLPPLDCDGIHSIHFPSGRVGTGMFVFARECLEKTGYPPPWRNHLELADGIDEWLGYETGYSSAKRWVGNPWGDDFCWFRKLSMHYRVHIIHAALYVQYVR